MTRVKQLYTLTLGELQRLHKYGVTTVALLVALMWFGLLFFIDDVDLLSSFLPMIILIDATMMAVIYIGAVMFFEKTEKTISTMLVTPVRKSDLIISKVIANTISQSISTLLVVILFVWLKGVEVSWFFMLLAIIISIVSHSLLGFLFSYYSKDFTTMLVNLMTYIFLLAMPVFLYEFEIVLKGPIFEYILMFTPIQWALHLIAAGFNGALNLAFYVSLVMMLLFTIFGYKYVIYPKFKTYAVRESGV